MAKTFPAIAIVDDDPSVLRALARLLGARSFDARTFPSARQFLASLADWRPDYLILDFQMPEMTGLELQRDLSANGINIPTIIITARDDVGLRERCRSAGAIAYLSKPIEGESLFAALEAGGSGSEG
jgi:FixJ family two-component response regulator